MLEPRKPIGMRSRLMSNPAKRSEKSIVREPTRFARPVSSTAIEMKKTAEEAESEKRTRVRMNFRIRLRRVRGRRGSRRIRQRGTVDDAEGKMSKRSFEVK